MFWFVVVELFLKLSNCYEFSLDFVNRLSPKQCSGHLSLNIILSHRGHQTATFLLNLSSSLMYGARTSPKNTAQDSLQDPLLLKICE